MIVVDTNIIAYLYLPSDYTTEAERLFDLNPHWTAPYLWRSELRNILALYLRKKIVDLETAYQIQMNAEIFLGNNEYTVNSVSVLALAHESECSAYDCEFVSLAQALKVKLVTTDKKLIRIFPETAISMKEYISAALA